MRHQIQRKARHPVWQRQLAEARRAIAATADAPELDVVDGGGNTAALNGNPWQCIGVVCT